MFNCSISNNGTLVTTFITLSESESINYSFFGEGMTFDGNRNRYILGSLQLGTLIAAPRSGGSSSSFVQYNEHDVTFILNSRPESFNGSNFLGLEMNPTNSDEVWGCIAYGPWSTYGLAKVNLTSDNVTFYDLSYLVRNYLVKCHFFVNIAFYVMTRRMSTRGTMLS
jgi:hypothetical protein